MPLPNGWRLSCGAKLKCSQMKAYNTIPIDGEANGRLTAYTFTKHVDAQKDSRNSIDSECNERRECAKGSVHFDRLVDEPPNGVRLSCGALKKDSFLNLRAPSASSAC
jgi:hypothetical protein